MICPCKPKNHNIWIANIATNVGIIPLPKLVSGAWIIWYTKSWAFSHGVSANTALNNKKIVNVKHAGINAENDFDTAGGTVGGLLIVQFLFTIVEYK